MIRTLKSTIALLLIVLIFLTALTLVGHGRQQFQAPDSPSVTTSSVLTDGDACDETKSDQMRRDRYLPSGTFGPTLTR